MALKMPGNLEGTLSKPIPLAILGILYFVLLVNLSFWLRGWINFQMAYLPVSVSFILLAIGLYGSTLYKKFLGLPMVWKFLIVMFLAAAFRALFLPHYPTLSQDIFRYMARASAFLQGEVPYRDFAPKKPPLYVYLLASIGQIFGIGSLPFRIIFALVDSLNAGLLLFIPYAIKRTESRTSRFWTYGILLYAIYPVPILEAALAGHFDPVVVLMVILALLALFFGRGLLSGIFIGAGFSLKLYPLFLLPGFFMYLKDWKQRTLFVIGFFIIPIIVSIPTIMVDPKLLPEYFASQSLGWYYNPSIQGALAYGFLRYLPDWFSFNLIFQLLFLGIAGLHLLSVFGNKAVRVFWIKLILVVIVVQLFILLGFQIGLYYLEAKEYMLPYIIMVVISNILLIIFVIVNTARAISSSKKNIFSKPRGRMDQDKPFIQRLFDPINSQTLLLSSLFILTLLIFSQAQIHPWYFLWLFPFIVGIGDRTLMRTFFFIFAIVPQMFYAHFEFYELMSNSPRP